jgi:hypothetical protein
MTTFREWVTLGGPFLTLTGISLNVVRDGRDAAIRLVQGAYPRDAGSRRSHSVALNFREETR